MAKTLEAELKARRNDPRALRATLSLMGGKTRIILPAVGEHARKAIEVDGDEISLVDDRPVQAAGETKAETPKGGKKATAPKEGEGGNK